MFHHPFLLLPLAMQREANKLQSLLKRSRISCGKGALSPEGPWRHPIPGRHAPRVVARPI